MQPPDSISSFPALSKKAKTFVGIKNGVSEIVSQVSHKNMRCLQSHLLICDTGQALLKQEFSNINEKRGVEMTKAPYGLGPLL